MIEKVMKEVKRGNKKRSINITVGAVVGFLLSCTAVMGAGLEITGNGINFEVTSGTIEGNTFENNTYTNNGEIKPGPGAGGIKIDGTSGDKKLSFINNGVVDVQSYEGIKIDNDADIIGKITNNGVMLSKAAEGIKVLGTLTAESEIAIENNGTVDAKTTSINIENNATVTGDVVNKGVIESEGISSISSKGILNGNIKNIGVINNTTRFTSYGIKVDGTLTGNIENAGVINTTSTEGSSYGIIANGGIENTGVINSTTTGNTSYGIVGGTLNGNIENAGVINSTTTGNISYGILSGTPNGNTENTGRIVSKASKSSSGIETTNSSGTIKNDGYLDVNSTDGSGIGILGGSGTNRIDINGRVKVAGSADSTGIKMTETKILSNNGLINSGDVGLSIDRGNVDALYLGGVIYGKTNAIKYKDTGTINNAANYGLLINQGNDNGSILSGTDFNSITNYGLAFSVGSGDKEGRYFFNNENKQTYTQKNRTVINAKIVEAENYDGTGEATGTESILSSQLTTNPQSDYGNATNQYIMNGITDTFKVVDKDKKLSGTIGTMINAYGRAMVMEEGAELIAEHTIFNGGINGDETVLLKGNNILNLSGTANGNSVINGVTKITGDSNTFTMNKSIQNGDITADGDGNTISLIESYINGDIANTGTGSTLTIDKSILNGNMTATGDNNDISVANSILNGNMTATGDNNDISVANSILNGDTTITGDENTLNISGEDTYINGNIIAADGKNTLNFNGKKDNGSSLNMFHEVSGFNEINIDSGSVTFFEDSKVTGTDKVTVAEDAALNLRLKKTGNKTEAGLNEVTHAFSENGKVVMEGLDKGGTLKFITNGIGQGALIDTKDMSIDNMHIATNSALDGYKFDEKGNLILAVYGSLDEMNKSGDLLVSKILSENIPGFKNFGAIDSIYKGIYSSSGDDVKNLEALKGIMHFDRNSEIYAENTSDEEQLKNLQVYLNEVYTQSPYALSSELSRRSAGMFRDIVTENEFRPNPNKWMIMGGLTHIDGGTKDTYYGEVYQIDGKNSSETAADTKLTGAYALGKYGYSENVTLGVTVGGNRSEAELSRSKVKGNSGYIGAFAENYRGNLTLKAGAGVQYSEYDADRNTIGGYSYSDKYSDMTYDIYLNGRYSHNIGDNLFLEPYATLSYTYVDQEGTDEGSKVLAIETDSKSFDYTSAKVGVDLKKVIPHEKGKSTLSAGVSYTRLLSGADSDNLTGRFNGGSDFDILVASKNEHSLGLNAKYALELQSGILFDVKGSYSFERDSHNDNARNRNKGEWIIGAGLGYKF